MKVKHLVTTAAAMLIALTSVAHAASSDEIENAKNHGYNSAAFEKVCPGMTVGNPALKAKLDAKYRNNPKMKKYFMEDYNLAAEQNKDKLTGVLILCLNTASDAKWIKQDPAAMEQLKTAEKDYRAQKDQAHADDKNWKRAYFISVMDLYSKHCDGYGPVPADLQAWAADAVKTIAPAILSDAAAKAVSNRAEFQGENWCKFTEGSTFPTYQGLGQRPF